MARAIMQNEQGNFSQEQDKSGVQRQSQGAESLLMQPLEEDDEELQPSLQRQEEEEEELQPKLQRQEEEEEIQTKL